MTVSVTFLSHGTTHNGSLGTKTLGTGFVVLEVSALYITGGNPTVSSVTIAGVAATLLARRFGTGNGTDMAVELWSAPCTVASGNVTVSWNSGALRGGHGLWRLTGAEAAAYDVASAIVDNPSVILEVPDGGAILAATANAVGTSATTWSGLSTEDYDELCPPDTNTYQSGAHQAFATGAAQTVSTNGTGSSGIVLVAVSFSPDNTPPPPPPPPPDPTVPRVRLDAPLTTSYVNCATGSDTTGDGSESNPWQTPTHAWNFYRDYRDFVGGASVEVVLQTDCPFSNNMTGGLTGYCGTFTFRGAHPGIQSTAASGYAMWSAGRGVVYMVQDMEVRPNGQTQTGLNPAGGTIVLAGSAKIIGNNAASLVQCIGAGAIFAYGGPVSVGGSANCGFLAENQATLQLNAPLLIAGSLAVGTGANGFCVVDWGSLCDAEGFSCSGSVTGQKYRATSNAGIHSGGSTFPGTVAGSVATGGWYE